MDSAALDTTGQSEPAASNSSRLMCAASGAVDSKDERQSDQNLSLVSPMGDAEYDAHPGLSAGQRVQLVSVPQNLPASPGPLRGDRQMQSQSRSSNGGLGNICTLSGAPVVQPESEDVDDLPSPSSGVGANAQSVPAQNRTARYGTVRYRRV